ncbi:alpha-galactosidase [Porticoccaceae bacterium]|nr:alpha-galactosidase [Porticoccaceae bacterium]
MPEQIQPFYTVHSDHCSLVLDCRSSGSHHDRHGPAILYWGPRLGADTTPEMLALMATRQEAQACMPEEAPIALSPELGAGFQGNAGIQLHRDGRQWASYSKIDSVTEDQNGALKIVSICLASEIKVTHRLALDKHSDVLTATTELTNIGSQCLWVEQCNAPTIPVPMHYNKILGFAGRWGNEFQRQPVDRFMGTYLRENRSGRSSHDAFPGVILHTEQTNEGAGAAYGLHLGWSGNHQIRVEEQFVGRAYAQMGELFFPGELSLEPNQSYCSPTLYGVSSENGLSALSQSFHRYIRAKFRNSSRAEKPRPVHFNTWEAMYFDLSLERLCSLADKAADVGVERFVLDDGWFKNRRSDSAGLGDWFVDKSIFPQGLSPLIDYVQAKGMEFGLWVEPEMVSPDSDLYRAHPDWILRAETGLGEVPLLLARNQLVLDLTRPEVQEYLFNCIDGLLSQNAISYLKWDMNRAVNQPGGKSQPSGAGGRAVPHYQTLALYQLLARIRDAHPAVEIESCASGGGRADLGILSHTDRIWTSDTNDALDRLRIQNGFSLFFPAEIMGAHVGPKDCHITGRSIAMATRAGVALFGHMGIEANLLTMDEAEKTELRAAVALHKQHRQLIHSGDLVRLDCAANENSFGMISTDREQGLFSYALLDSHRNSAPGRLCFRGLDPKMQYKINIIWPLKPSSISTSILDVINGAVISGDALANFGVQLPIMLPQSLLIFYFQKH